MFVEWNDRALASDKRPETDVPVGKGRYSYQTHASLVGMVRSRIAFFFFFFFLGQ